jgi:hypothetical protein
MRGNDTKLFAVQFGYPVLDEVLYRDTNLAGGLGVTETRLEDLQIRY